MSKYKSRISKLSQFLDQNQALLLSTPTDIVYLTGFNHLVPEERESFLLITPNTNIFFHTSFSPFGSPAGVNVRKSCSLNKISDEIKKLNQENGLKELLVDKSNLFVSEYETLSKFSFLKLASFDRQHIWKIRTIKDDQEIISLKKAADITSQAIASSIKSLQVGMTEIQLKEIIESELKKAGSEKPAFPTIVAFGPNSALPHHQPTTTVLEEEMPVLIDLGAVIDGYNGDMTRTVWFGKQSTAKFLKIEKIVKDAYKTTLETLKNRGDGPILAKDLDQVARSVITKAGYGKNFIHTTGHGLGLDLHENLSLNWNNSQPILSNMVITIEPGIYLKDEFGYRYENMILVTSDGAEELTY